MPWVFPGVEPAEKFPVGIGERAEIILRPNLHSVHRQAKGARFLLYPAERHIGKPPIVIPAADVAMGADKPALLQYLRRRAVGIPQGSHIIVAMFIDGDRVVRVFNDVAQIGIVKFVELYINILENVERDPERVYRVLHFDEFNFDLSAKR